jgi:hypothetical protein
MTDLVITLGSEFSWLAVLVFTWSLLGEKLERMEYVFSGFHDYLFMCTLWKYRARKGGTQAIVCFTELFSCACVPCINSEYVRT